MRRARATKTSRCCSLLRPSRWHWAQVGGPEQIATGDWQVARVASLLGVTDLALVFAQRSLDTTTAEGWDGWRLASAYEGMSEPAAPPATPTDGNVTSRWVETRWSGNGTRRAAKRSQSN